METMRLLPKAFILPGFFLLFSCDPNMVFEKNQPIHKGLWNAKESIPFEVYIADTTHACNLYVNIRNKGSYPNSNLFLFITVVSPAGETLKDTAEFILADNKGRWNGRGIGDLYFRRIPWKQNVRFPHSGIYRFELEQAMRTDPLPGITDIGLRIEKLH